MLAVSPFLEPASTVIRVNTALVRARGAAPNPAARLALPTDASALYEFSDLIDLPWRARSTLYVLAALIMTAIAWGSVARVDMVVAADGKLTTSQQLTVIQPIELSVVRDLTVRIGDQVRVGQTVATLDRTNSQADLSDARAKRAAGLAALERIKAEMAGLDYNPTAPTEAERSQREIFLRRGEERAAQAKVTHDKISDFETKLAAKQNEMQHLAEQAQFSAQSQRIYLELVNTGVGSKLKLLDSQRAVAEVQQKIVSNEGEQRSLREQIQTTKSEFDSYMGERTRKLADEAVRAASDYDEASAKLAKATMRNDLVVLKSPIDGTVLQVADRLNGSVVREAETLVTLVPKDAKLVADLHVETRDIARLKIGQAVKLKLEALPYQQFGYLEGKIAVITPDTLVDEGKSEATGAPLTPQSDNGAGKPNAFYRVQVEVIKNSLRNLPDMFVLRPGMKIAGNVNVGDRSILQYIFNPITRGLNDSLREP